MLAFIKFFKFLFVEKRGNYITYYQNTVSRMEAHFEGNDDVVFVAVSIDGRREKWLGTLCGGAYSSKDAFNLYTAGGVPSIPLYKSSISPSIPHRY
ncbi:hypothetical protein [Sphingobacterium sp. SYP-B4668]|uniref:hypothetical protein n=1 Tax=Sphingobacterium sp. SYP-B4668 TaxID=2996035 RepID=UPI0022DE8EFB|nr:hypothetical protein [Sphingobacterium sp. SYP-B4668]